MSPDEPDDAFRARLRANAAAAAQTSGPALTDEQMAEATLWAAQEVNKALAVLDHRICDLEARGIHTALGFFKWRQGPGIEVGQPMQVHIEITRRVFLGGLG